MQLRTIVNTSNAFWTQNEAALRAELACGLGGLDSAEAERRMAQFGPNSDIPGKRIGVLSAALRRLLEPLCLILLAAAGVAISTGDGAGGTIIVAILALSIGLDTFQEGRAARAAELLRQSVALKAEVRRDGTFKTVPVESVVPGDIVRVRAEIGRAHV